MKEEEFNLYLIAYAQSAARQPTHVPDWVVYGSAGRGRATVAVAAFDVLSAKPPRSPAELNAELDRICAGVIPTTPVNG